MHLHNNTTHTIRTQFAHNFHTIRTHTETETNKQRYMQHIEDNREQNIEDTHIEQHTEQTQYPDTERTQNTDTQHSTDYLHTYSFDFIVYDNISKNSIIQIYTKFIHFGHLINKVSK